MTAMAEDKADQAPAAKRRIRVRQMRSSAGRLRKHRACVAGLGLRRVGHTVEVEDSAAVRGMIAQVPHLVRVLGE